MTSMRRTQRPGDTGAVAILTAIMIPVLIVLTAMAVDVGRWYVESAKVQKAADAAALGGVTYMPNNFPNASTTAVDLASQNGFPVVTGTTVTPFRTGVDSELGVTVSSTVFNIFGSIFGKPKTVVTRSAVADYQGPAIMGSPCNTFGNEPNSTSTTTAPEGTSIPTTAQGGYDTCQSRSPNFWATIEGPQTEKQQGDRYSTRTCASGTDGCAGTTNSEYDANGYFFVVRVGQDAINNPVTVQLFDPAFILTENSCSALPTPRTVNVSSRTRSSNVTTITTSSSHGLAVGDGVRVAGVSGTGFNGDVTVTAVPSSNQFRYANAGSNVSSSSSSGTVSTMYNGMNPWVPSDMATRYGRSASSGYCTGDYFPGGGSSPMVTSFALRDRTLTYNPLLALPIPGCVKQFGSVTSGPSAASLNSSSSSSTYKGQVARLLHQWIDLCTFTPTVAGDYYLQVRSSASTAGAAAETAYDPNGTTLIYNNGANATSETATQTTGHGDNSFGIRAYVGAGTSQPNALNAEVSVAGYIRMPMYQNVASGSTFNLLQVKPDAAGKDFYFDLFDVGDGAVPEVTVLPPLESGLADTALTNCKYKTSLASTTYLNANKDGYCRFQTNAANGKVFSMIIPIPNGYTCDYTSPGGCWFRVAVNWSGGQPSDITTWNASIGGNALRLVQ